MRVIGLMSGTSIDAVDAALVDIAQRAGTLHVSMLGFSQTPWPSGLRERVRRWSDTRATVLLAELGPASMEIGELFAAAAERAAAAAGGGLEAVDLICSHGQTIHHVVGEDGRAVASIQLGQPAVIAERTGRTVVADFRPRDIAAGGQGAPLVSFVDALAFGEQRRTVAALNLGGIANLTVVPVGTPSQAVAFDTGPGNSLIDGAARRLLGHAFDRDGAVAAATEPSAELLAELLAHPYFHRRPPKSTGRELFGDEFLTRAVARSAELGLDAGTVLATLTELTARTVATGLARWSPAWPAVLHVSGGGTRNLTLMGALERALADEAPDGAQPPLLRRTDDAGMPAAAKEAVAFAILGHEALHGRPNSLPSSTGARHPSVLGAIWPGENYRRLLAFAGRPRQQRERIDRIVVRRSRQMGAE